MKTITEFLRRPGIWGCLAVLSIGVPASIVLLPRPLEGLVFWMLVVWGGWHFGARMLDRNTTYKKELEKYEPDNRQ